MHILTRLAPVLQSGSQGGSDSAFLRLLDEARLSVTDRQPFMVYSKETFLGTSRTKLWGPKGAFAVVLGQRTIPASGTLAVVTGFGLQGLETWCLNVWMAA